MCHRFIAFLLPFSLLYGASSPCDLNADGQVNVVDVQRATNQASGIESCVDADLNGDGQCNVVDVQRFVNAALGQECQAEALPGVTGRTFTYYVDATNGSDSNPGTLAAPWKTIAKVNSTKLTAGQSVAFKAGGVWREQLTVPSSGTAGSPITFGSYGSGAQPVVDGSEPTSWSAVTANVWSTAATTDPRFPLFGNSPGILQPNVSSVTAANHWYWDDAADVLYVYSATDPTASVTIPTRNYAIYLDGKSYVTIDGLSWRGAWALGGGLFAVNGSSYVTVTNSTAELNYGQGIMFYDPEDTQTGGTISSNTVRYNGAGGINVNHLIGTNWTITHNTVYSNGLRAHAGFAGPAFQFLAGIYLYDDTVSSGASIGGSGTVVSDNHVYSNGPNTGVANGSQGVGIWSDSLANVIVTRNFVHDNASSGIRFEKNMGSTLIYNVLRDNCNNTVPFQGNIELLVSGESPAIKSNNNLVANNTSYGGYFGLSLNVQLDTGTAEFSNNTIYNNIAVAATHANMAAQPGATNDGVWGSGNVYGYNNFGPEAAGFIDWATWEDGAPVYDKLPTYAAFDAAYGSNTHSVGGDHLFTNAAGGDFTLATGSPLIGAGVHILGVSTANPPNIGAN